VRNPCLTEKERACPMEATRPYCRSAPILGIVNVSAGCLDQSVRTRWNDNEGVPPTSPRHENEGNRSRILVRAKSLCNFGGTIDKFSHKCCCSGLFRGASHWRRDRARRGPTEPGSAVLTGCNIPPPLPLSSRPHGTGSQRPAWPEMLKFKIYCTPLR
jgi:hypothetical protein